ncbi:DUF6087 family protein [Streptomyces sp. NPDC013171]|uniref:DUF6087 family protein n=1 Tax=Streptomyces sp. NPDC013171 TaxID=3364863 RepID=UPI0036973237
MPPMSDPEEPLTDWARRREERLAERRGRRRAVPLVDGPLRGSHVAPSAPRAILEYDGLTWVPVTVAADLAEAQALLYPPPPEPARPPERDRSALGEGRSRHRRTPSKPGDTGA